MAEGEEPGRAGEEGPVREQEAAGEAPGPEQGVAAADLGRALAVAEEEPVQAGPAQVEEEEELGPAGQMAAAAVADRGLGAEGEDLDQAQAEVVVVGLGLAQVAGEEEELGRVDQKEVEVEPDLAREVAEAELGSCPCQSGLRFLGQADRCLGPEEVRLGRRHHRQPLHQPR